MAYLLIRQKVEDYSIWFQWDNMENAKAFIDDPELLVLMNNAGVVEPINAYFLEGSAHDRLW